MTLSPALAIPLLLVSLSMAALSVPDLTTTEAIRSLTREEANRHTPVALRGVLTYSDPALGVAFIQDESGGIYFRPPPGEPHAVAGDLVEIAGVTWFGIFSPSVAGDPADLALATSPDGGKCVRLTRLGQGTLPVPPLVTIDRIESGELHDQFVKLRGTIRRVAALQRDGQDRYCLDITSRQGSIRAMAPAVGRLPIEWENTDAELHAVVCGTSDESGTLSSVMLLLQSLAQVTPDFKATERAFASPVRRFAELLRYEPPKRAESARRVHVAGIVTLLLPGSGFFLGHEDGSGLWVQTVQTTPVQLGDRLDVAGFAVRGIRTVILEDAIYRLREHGAPLAPSPLALEKADNGDQHSALVQVDGQLIEQIEQPSYRLLFLESAGRTFYARVVGSGRDAAGPPLKNGSLLRLTGICERAPDAVPGGAARWQFSLLLRSPEDVAVLRQPPWLTARRLRWLLAGVGGAALLGFAWVAILRRQVAHQARRIAEESGQRHVVEERQRIARELHDTLDQQLTGVYLHLDAAADWAGDLPPHVVAAIVQARAMLTHSRAEARRSIFELRSLSIEQAGLVGALRHSVSQSGTTGESTIEITVRGVEHPLPRPVEFHLLRIAQESITNAIKHATATRIEVVFDFTDDVVCLSISDDGCGFDPAAAPSGGGAHFGILGIRERVAKFHGRLHLRSAPGAGTTVTVTAPTTRHDTSPIHA